MKRERLEELKSKVLADKYKRGRLMASNLLGLEYYGLRAWEKGAEEPEK